MPEKPLGCSITLVHYLACTPSYGLLGQGKAQSAGVGRDFVSQGATEELVDGLAGQLALEVPDRTVHGAQRLHRGAFPAVGLDTPVHPVPYALVGGGVLIDDVGLYHAVDQKGLGLVYRAGEAHRPVFGLHLGEDAGDRNKTFRGIVPHPGRHHVLRAPDPKIGIGVYGHRDALFPDGLAAFQLPLKLDRTYVCDLHSGVHLDSSPSAGGAENSTPEPGRAQGLRPDGWGQPEGLPAGGGPEPHLCGRTVRRVLALPGPDSRGPPSLVRSRFRGWYGSLDKKRAPSPQSSPARGEEVGSPVSLDGRGSDEGDSGRDNLFRLSRWTHSSSLWENMSRHPPTAWTTTSRACQRSRR